jgi:hypothetical protein
MPTYKCALHQQKVLTEQLAAQLAGAAGCCKLAARRTAPLSGPKLAASHALQAPEIKQISTLSWAREAEGASLASTAPALLQELVLLRSMAASHFPLVDARSQNGCSASIRLARQVATRAT